MTTTLLNPVAAFAAAVRDALGDLPADEVDDLTDGLEADLSERLADRDIPDDANLGDPVAYASELRMAAGLPPRTVAARSSFASNVRALSSRFATEFRNLPLVVATSGFFSSVRPAWWIFRGWLGYVLIVGLMNRFTDIVPVRTWQWVALAVTVFLSVQFGRGKWLPWAWARTLFVLVNVVAVIFTPIVAFLGVGQFILNREAYVTSLAPDPEIPDGLYSGGHQVTNVFAYDAAGNPLTDVQLFDQDGNPLESAGAQSAYGYYFTRTATGLDVLVPNTGVVGSLGWNVYPLDSVDQSALTPEQAPDAATPRVPATAPYVTVTPLVGSD